MMHLINRKDGNHVAVFAALREKMHLFEIRVFRPQDHSVRGLSGLDLSFEINCWMIYFEVSDNLMSQGTA